MTFLLILYLIVLFVCFLIGTNSYLHLKTKNILLYVLLSVIIEIIGCYYLYFSSGKRIFNFGFQLFTIFEFLIFSLYFEKITFSKIIKKIIKLIIFPVILIYLFSFFGSIKVNFYNYQITTISNILFTIYSILFLKELLDRNVNIQIMADFWVVIAILFYNSCFFFLSAFLNYILLKDKELGKNLFQINHFLNIIYYSLFAYSFFLQKKEFSNKMNSI